MDTNRLKRFATEARNILMQGVAHRFTALGFLPDGTYTEEPQRFEGGATFMGETVTVDFFEKWQSLARAIQKHSLKEVAEEAAYTWFNRLMAIRIMVKNQLISPVLQYESEGVFVPLIVTEARQGRLPEMKEDERRKLITLLDDDSQTAEQFRILIVAFCHDTPVINACFGHIADYTELLLPANILAEGGFVDLINHTDFIAEDDYKSPELIGWLYQFYISEKKDDVFASFKKGKKAEAEDIPAATQIFTPNWIVKYMVQNTIGRIYLDNNPYEEDIQKNWKYLIDPTEKTPDDKILHYDDLKELKFGDLACGSGHILNEGFDILYELYILEGYSRKDAIENIFRFNLTGIDIDTRAKQLAQFALLLKACQKDASFADAHTMPQVLDMPEPYPDKDNLHDTLPHFFLGGNEELVREVCDAIIQLDQGKNLGSIMKFNISERTRNAIMIRMDEYQKETHVPEAIRRLMPYMCIILALTEKYSAIMMNPPYMSDANMNSRLAQYVRDNYIVGKSDMYSTFMCVAMQHLLPKGKMGLVTMESWMFISSFESLRRDFINKYTFESLSHFDWHIMHIAFGTVAFVVSNMKCNGYIGTYSYLFRDEMNWDKDIPKAFPSTSNGRFCKLSQNEFLRIPGAVFGYWIYKMFDIFDNNPLSDYVVTKAGTVTGKDSFFIRNWQEVSFNDICLDKRSYPNYAKYHIFQKGGGARKYYGNNECLIKLKYLYDDNYYNVSIRRGDDNYYFRNAVGWSQIGATDRTFRIIENSVCGTATPTIYADTKEDNFLICAYLNSPIGKLILKIINPTINTHSAEVVKLPYIKIDNLEMYNLAKECYDISKEDWDVHETSWDFQRTELLTMDEQVMFDNLNYLVEKHFKETGEHICIDPVAPKPESVEWCYDTYCTKWERLFMHLHHNEEELNCDFIEIYGLQDELTSDVPKDEITILQQGEISIEDNQIVWHPDVVMKQLISYSVGCMMGRYSIDKPGLILANQGDGIEKYNELLPNSRFEADDDGIVPLMSAQSDFADNATVRFKQWLVAAFGEETLVENLNFIEKSLGKSIDDYFVKDFWKDHKKTYENRPIYWLFSSKKGAFQCLAYMHRMDAYTAERIRTKYLLPHIEWLIQKQNEMEANAANLNSQERKQLDNIVKQIEECREYHDRLHVIADEQIGFDLDDGVVVNYTKFGDVLAKLK